MIKPNSKVVAKLRNDELVTSAKLNITHPIVAAQVAMAGFDMVWADMEHIPSDYNEINQVFLAAKAYGAETIVRVARGSYSDHVRPLEMDCTAVMVPHVLSAEDAKKVAYMTKFHPLGRRAIDGGFADGLYCKMGTADYIEYANNERLTVIQIEDFEALEQIDEIAAVPGIDMLFFGPADFAHSLGIPTQMGDERVAKARLKVAETARKYGKFAGTVGNPGNVKDLYDMGYRYVNLCADVAILGRNFREVMEKCQTALGK
jgi:4-hydroxy-2-oxoheptanedioate aldolase